jgi:hypothetical protein
LHSITGLKQSKGKVQWKYIAAEQFSPFIFIDGVTGLLTCALKKYRVNGKEYRNYKKLLLQLLYIYRHNSSIKLLRNV